MKTIMSILKKNNITISDNNVSLELNKCLPDSSDEFNSFFIDNDIGIAFAFLNVVVDFVVADTVNGTRS